MAEHLRLGAMRHEGVQSSGWEALGIAGASVDRGNLTEESMLTQTRHPVCLPRPQIRAVQVPHIFLNIGKFNSILIFLPTGRNVMLVPPHNRLLWMRNC